MAAPEGNTNAEGNRGGGRKSAYQEMADAEALHKMFFGEQNQADILAKVKAGKYSLKDAFVAAAFGGDTKVLVEIFKKIFPDSLNIGGQPGNPLRTLSDGEIAERIKKYTISLAGSDSETTTTGGTDPTEIAG